MLPQTTKVIETIKNYFKFQNIKAYHKLLEF